MLDSPDRLPEVNPPTAWHTGFPTFGQEPEVFGFTFTPGLRFMVIVVLLLNAMRVKRPPVEKRRNVIQKWNYFRPRGPHMDAKADINEMKDVDVEKLLQIGDEMAELLSP